MPPSLNQEIGAKIEIVAVTTPSALDVTWATGGRLLNPRIAPHRPAAASVGCRV